jgi:hypothetical protein
MGEAALIALAATAAAGSAASTGLSIHQANVRNEQIKKAQEQASRQLTARRTSLAQAAAEQRKRTLAAGHRLRGQLRVAATARGGGSDDNSSMALLQQIALATAGDLETISSNLALNQETATAQGLAQLNSLQSRVVSPALVGLEGSLSTISTAISGIELVRAAQSAPTLPVSGGLGVPLDTAPRSQFGQLLNPPDIGHTANLQR